MRYWMLGAPPGPAGGALMPGMPPSARATTYWQVKIWGQPGTQGIPAPKPEGVVPTSQNRRNQGSYNSPDVIFPSLYYTTPENMHAPVSLFRDNPLPVPAVGAFNGVARLPNPAMNRRPVAGRNAIGWPAVVTRWGSRNNASN